MMKHRRSGLTLIGIMVVVLILGIIASVVVANVGGRPSEVKGKLTNVAISKLKGEIQLFKVEQNRYPETLEDLVRRPAYVDARKWPEHGYLEALPLDGWDRPFEYAVPGSKGPFDLISRGEDGKPGGEGVNAVLYSHSAR